jgi:hypothetical protein
MQMQDGMNGHSGDQTRGCSPPATILARRPFVKLFEDEVTVHLDITD